jgi:hypothetical protein
LEVFWFGLVAIKSAGGLPGGASRRAAIATMFRSSSISLSLSRISASFCATISPNELVEALAKFRLAMAADEDSAYPGKRGVIPDRGCSDRYGPLELEGNGCAAQTDCEVTATFCEAAAGGYENDWRDSSNV